MSSGGGLVASLDTSLCNEFGDPRPDFALADVLGVHHSGPTNPENKPGATDGAAQPAAATGSDLDINIANILEREYATYEAAKIHKQLDWKANIVVVQCAENVPPKEFDAAAFPRSLQTLLNDLKESSNPHIFVTSNILWGNPGLDEIKRKACDEEPAHRTFVDIKRSRLRRSKFKSVTVRAVSST